MRPYDRLIGAALDGDRWLFARQDTVEAAWKIVDPVLGDVVPVHPYARGSWGPGRGRPAAARPGHLARPGRLSQRARTRDRDESTQSGRRRVVIVGGGFAGLFAIRGCRRATPR